jgi:energy-coupling factor transporter ATP-binding protein EcfA2
MKPVTIFLCGPSGGGKTTLANALADRIGYHAVGSLTRIGYALNGVKNQSEALKLPPDEYRTFQVNLLKTYRSFVNTYLMNKSENVGLIFERTYYDYIPYAFPDFPEMPENECRQLCLNARKLHGNSILVYVPAPPKDWEFNDGFRAPTASNPQDSVTRQLFDEHSGNKLVLNSYDLEDRVQEVLNHLQQKEH